MISIGILILNHYIMKITVKNLTYNPVSVDTFKLDPQESRTFDIPDQVAERVIEQLDLASTTVSYRILGEIADDSITSPVTLHVETTGSDINPGTLAKPFKLRLTRLLVRRYATEY